MLEIHSFGDGFLVPISVMVQLENGFMIKNLDMIESEVNDILAQMWNQASPYRPHESNEAQHQICHLASSTYEMYKEHALSIVTEANNATLWELIEQLTDKMLACDEHVPELGL